VRVLTANISVRVQSESLPLHAGLDARTLVQAGRALESSRPRVSQRMREILLPIYYPNPGARLARRARAWARQATRCPVGATSRPEPRHAYGRRPRRRTWCPIGAGGTGCCGSVRSPSSWVCPARLCMACANAASCRTSGSSPRSGSGQTIWQSSSLPGPRERRHPGPTGEKNHLSRASSRPPRDLAQDRKAFVDIAVVALAGQWVAPPLSGRAAQ
jgi:hypothetical protein